MIGEGRETDPRRLVPAQREYKSTSAEALFAEALFAMMLETRRVETTAIKIRIFMGISYRVDWGSGRRNFVIML